MIRRIDTVYKEIGKRLYTTRTKRGWTQEKLAAESKVATAHIGFIEQGRRRPTLTTLNKLATALDISLEQLFKDL